MYLPTFCADCPVALLMASWVGKILVASHWLNIIPVSYGDSGSAPHFPGTS